MGFPFLSSLKPYVKSELLAKLDPVKFSLLKPWISVTSNLGPNGYTLRSDSYSDIFGVNGKYESNQSSLNGFKPRPIITGFNVDFASRGVTKKGTISFKCFTLDQFQLIQEYFLEPGISVFVQWGWNKSSISNQTIYAKPIDADTQIKYYRTNETLTKDRDATNGCYDNFMGIITGGKSSINNGEYDVECQLTAIGEILMGSSVADPAVPVCEKVDKPPVKAFTANEMSTGRINANHTYHWMAFFNSLPDGLKNIADMKSLGLKATSGIDTRVDFINYDEESMEDAKDEADGAIIFTDQFNVAGKQITGVDSDIGSPISDAKYIRFKALAVILNHIQQKKQQKSTSVDDKTPGSLGLDLSNAYCGAVEGMYSVDPSCFIPNKNSTNFMEQNAFFQNFDDIGYEAEIPMKNHVVGIGETEVSFPTEKDESIQWNNENFPLPKGTVGKIENLYINHDLAVECITSALNSSIKDCLDDMLKTIEKATLGLWDFQVIKPEDVDNGKITIIDCNLTTFNQANTKPAPVPFTLFGNQCVFLEFEFDSNIPKGLMNQIVMDKSAPKSADDVNSSTKGKGLFTNQKDIVIVDTVKVVTVDPCASDKPPAEAGSSSKTKEDKKANFDGFVKTSKILLQPKYSKNTNPINLKGLLIPGISTNSAAELAKQQSGENGAIGSPINSKIKFKVLGNSGFRVGDLLTVKNLPKAYQYNPTEGKSGAFMVLSLSHTVEEKGWFTNIEAMFRPY